VPRKEEGMPVAYVDGRDCIYGLKGIHNCMNVKIRRRNDRFMFNGYKGDHLHAKTPR
jgi:hypothetical protein